MSFLDSEGPVVFVLVCTFLSPYCCRPCPSPGFHAHFCTYITRIRRRTLHRIYPRTRIRGAGQTVVVSLRGWYPRQVSVTSIVSVPHVWLMLLGWLMRRPSAILPSFLLVLPLSLSRFQLDAWLDLSFVNTGLVSIQTTRALENSTTNSRLTHTLYAYPITLSSTNSYTNTHSLSIPKKNVWLNSQYPCYLPCPCPRHVCRPG